jgi:hypothetical protein
MQFLYPSDGKFSRLTDKIDEKEPLNSYWQSLNIILIS